MNLTGEELKLALASQGTRLVGRYLLCDQIGAGGMATIHLARLLGPQGFSRTVAVKQLYPQFAQNPEFVAMFLDEARLAVRIRHGNVVSPIDVVASDGELLIVMDYVNGESLAALLRAANGPLPPAIASAILVQVLLGLHAAHEATREQGEALGLVHRDVSPQNILVGQDGVARVLDFGIAKAVARSQITEGGMLKGKLGYMAPEQLRLEPVDRRADLFTAGIVLWEALTGTGLFLADDFGASIELTLHGEISPPSQRNPAVSPELDAVVMKALTREPSERFQDALSMAAALQRVMPPASTLEVITWVEHLAGAELTRRAELVRRAEALEWEGSQSLTPGPLVARERPSGAQPAPKDPSGSHTARIVPGLSVTVETTDPAGGTDAAPSPKAAGESRRRKVLAAILGATLVTSTAVLFAFSLTRSDVGDSPAGSQGTLSIHRASPASEPLAAEPSSSPRESVAETPAPTLPNASGSAAPSPLEPQVLPVPAPSALAATRSAGRAPEKKPPRQKHENCNPPWTINEQHIKVFKAECLR